MRPAIFCFLSLLTLESCCVALSTLKQAVKPAGRPDPSQVTRALSELQTSNKRNETTPDGWLPTLTAQPWQPIFVATASELKEQAGGKYNTGSSGRRQIFTMEDENETGVGQYSSIFANLLFRALRFTVKGSFTMNGRNMSLVFETLEVRLMWFIKLAISVKEGSLVRGWLERLRGGKKGTAAEKFEKRPSVYIWCYADDDMCAAQGTSGSIALWGKAPN
jgi:hypothetical protein